jgi:hypothetical protein
MNTSKCAARTLASSKAFGLVLLTLGFVAHSSVEPNGRANGMLAAEQPQEDRKTVVEIRSYNLVAGARPEFHRLVVQESMPLLRQWNVDVVGYGPSQHDETSYYLVRAFESLEQRASSEAAFYASPEWTQGPREAILALIESYTTIVVELDDAALAALREALPPAP